MNMVTTAAYSLQFWENISNQITSAIENNHLKMETLLERLETNVDMKFSILAKAEHRRTQLSKVLTEIRMLSFLRYELEVQYASAVRNSGVVELELQKSVVKSLIRSQEILVKSLGDRESQEAQLADIEQRIANIKGVGDAVANEKARWRNLSVSLDILGESDLPDGSKQLLKLLNDVNNIDIKKQQAMVSYEVSFKIGEDIWPFLELFGIDNQPAIDL